MRIHALLLSLVAGAAGCATTTQDYRTGVRVSDPPRVYRSLTRVAEARSLHAAPFQGSLVVESSEGDRFVYTATDEVGLTVTARDDRHEEARRLAADLLVEAQRLQTARR